MKNFKSFAIAALMVLSLSACGPQQPQMIPQDVSQQVPVEGGFDTGDAAVGALVGAGAGYMMGRSGSNNQPRTIIVNQRPSYGYGKSYYGRKSTVTTTTTKRSMFGGRKTTTTRTTTRRR